MTFLLVVALVAQSIGALFALACIWFGISERDREVIVLGLVGLIPFALGIAASALTLGGGRR